MSHVRDDAKGNAVSVRKPAKTEAMQRHENAVRAHTLLSDAMMSINAAACYMLEVVSVTHGARMKTVSALEATAKAQLLAEQLIEATRKAFE